jgi:hypothetical protein
MLQKHLQLPAKIERQPNHMGAVLAAPQAGGGAQQQAGLVDACLHQ